MKAIFPLIFGLFTILVSCNKTCTADIPACTERPIDSALCQAVFKRWFYDETTGTCAKLTYSGCDALGFEEQNDCEKCDCK